MIERGLVGIPESSLVDRRSPEEVQIPNSWAYSCRLQSGSLFDNITTNDTSVQRIEPGSK